MNLIMIEETPIPNHDAIKTRRRGAALDDALLQAAWDELHHNGYSAFTTERVALRAQTSRPVIARRWASRGELALAAVQHYIISRPLAIPDETNIRAELIDYIVALYERGFPVIMMMWTQMDDYFREEKSSPAHFHERLLAGQVSAIEFLLRRAARRGEVDAGKLTEMVLSIPAAVLSYLTMTQAPIDIRNTVSEMIDTILLPLVVAR